MLRMLKNRLGMLKGFYASGGRLRWDRDIGTVVARKAAGGGREMQVCIRSYRELRRFHEFGRSRRPDCLWQWLRWIRNCGVFYDIGASNGLEGLYVLANHGKPVVFVEPYTPSIESILKSVFVTRRDHPTLPAVEVVHAGCGASETYARLHMHGAPVAGENLNSFDDPAAYLRSEGGRQRDQASITQWVKGVTLDGLVRIHGLPGPTHVKIDVDGFELNVLRGATELLSSNTVASWAIETNGDGNRETVLRTMVDHGYVEAARSEHHPGHTLAIHDIVFVRPEALPEWNRFVADLKDQEAQT